MNDEPRADQEVPSLLTATVPAEWFVKESLTLLAPDGRANVIFSSEPVDPDIDTNRYTEIQGELLNSEFPEYLELEFDPIAVFGGLDGWARRFEWTADGDKITQIQLYVVHKGRGYTATATTPTDSYGTYEAQLFKVLQSLRINVHD